MSAIQWSRKDTDTVIKAVTIAAFSAVLVEMSKAAVEELQGWLFRQRKQAKKRRRRNT